MDTYDLQCRFIYAIMHQMYPRVIEMLNNGININHAVNPLRQAVKTKDMKLCKLLLTQGAKPDGPDQRGYPLIEAAEQGNRKMCQLLLEYGANPNTYPINNNPSAIDNALHLAYWDIYRLLSDAGAQYDMKHKKIKYHTTAYPLSDLFICESNIHPFISPREFQEFLTARSRIATALKALKDIRPSIPNDIKKQILKVSPALCKDIVTSRKFGTLHHINIENVSLYPIRLLKYLIQTGYFAYEEIVHQLKEDTLCMFEKRGRAVVFECDRYVEMKHFLPQILEKEYGYRIEKTIRRRLSSH